MINILSKLRKLEQFNLSDKQREILNSIEYDHQDQNYLASMIRKYLVAGFSLILIRDNWREIRALGRDSSSKAGFILRYGLELGDQLFTEKCKASSVTKEYLINKYGEEKATQLLSSRGASLDNYIARWGVPAGTQRWQEYNEKRSASYKIGRQEKKYASRNLSWFQKKYGEDNGYQIWDAKRKAQAYAVSMAGYIAKYGEEDGRVKIKEVKSRGEAYWLKKYGEVDGRARYISHCMKISAAKISSVSQWSAECCEEIKKVIDDLKFYGNHELCIGLPKSEELRLGKKIIRPDLFYRGRVIEFQGDVFHGNPSLFEATDTPHPYNNLTQSALRAIDNTRIEYYTNRGWLTLEIWEHEYRECKQEVIKQCIEFLTKTTK